MKNIFSHLQIFYLKHYTIRDEMNNKVLIWFGIKGYIKISIYMFNLALKED